MSDSSQPPQERRVPVAVIFFVLALVSTVFAAGLLFILVRLVWDALPVSQSHPRKLRNQIYFNFFQLAVGVLLAFVAAYQAFSLSVGAWTGMYSS